MSATEYSLEEQLPSEIIGKAMVVYGGEPREIDISSTDNMSEAGHHLFDSMIHGLDRLDSTPDTVGSVTTAYALLKGIQAFYEAVGGTLPVRVGHSSQEFASARNKLLNAFDMNEQEVDNILEVVFGFELPEPLDEIFRSNAIAAKSNGPATTAPVSVKDLLTPVALGLDEVMDKASAMIAKIEFAEGLTKLAYFTPSEGEEIVDGGENGTKFSRWSDQTSADAANFIFGVHGADGMKHLGGFIRGVLEDPENAGVPSALAAFRSAILFAAHPVLCRFYSLKALNPTASKDAEMHAAFIQRVVDAFAAAMQWDQYQEIVQRLRQNDKILKACVSRFLPDKYISSDVYETTKVFLARMSNQSLGLFRADLKVAQSYHEIRATAPYMLFMMGAQHHRNIKAIGPHGIRSVVRHFVDVHPEYFEIMNVLQPLQEQVEEFCRQDMTHANWTPQPLRLPHALTKNVNTSLAKIDNHYNTIQRVMTSITDQIKPEPVST